MALAGFEGASAIVTGGAGGLVNAVTFLLTNGHVNAEVLRLDGAQRFAPK